MPSGSTRSKTRESRHRHSRTLSRGWRWFRNPISDRRGLRRRSACPKYKARLLPRKLRGSGRHSTLPSKQVQEVEETRRRAAVQGIRDVVQHVAQNQPIAGAGGHAEVEVARRRAGAQHTRAGWRVCAARGGEAEENMRQAPYSAPPDL